MKAPNNDPNHLKGTDAAMLVTSFVTIVAAIVVTQVYPPKKLCKSLNYATTKRTSFLSLQLAQPLDLTYWANNLGMTYAEFNSDNPAVKPMMASMYIPSSSTNQKSFRSNWIDVLEAGLPKCTKQLFVTPNQGMGPIYHFLKGHDPAYDIRIIYVQVDKDSANLIGQYLNMLTEKYVFGGEGNPKVPCRGLGVLFYGPLLAIACEPDQLAIRNEFIDLSAQRATVDAIKLATSYCPQ
jgi:hypothetical protein